MKTKFPERTERLITFTNHLKIRNKTIAKDLDIPPSYVSQLLTFNATVTPTIAFKLSKAYPGLNMEWLLDGKGEMLQEEEKVKESIRPEWEKEPSPEAVNRLYDEVMKKFRPRKWTAKQDLTLREACYRCIVDNPGQPWSALLVGAGVYLRFIQSFPGAEIPGPDDPAENEKEYHAGDGG